MKKAIPRRILIDTAVLKTNEVKDDYGKIISEDPINLTYIRVDETAKLKQSKTDQEEQLTAIVFYDCRNSRPLNVTFVKDQTLVYNGSERRIVTIEPIKDDSRLHHYEIGVI